MAIFNPDLDYTNLIEFTNGTLRLASFVQIRNALIKRMKDIYGNDIDVSSASADGQYINSIALLINNIFQTIKQGYQSLDPASATGQYLDTLCSFNNIERINQSKSIAQLYICNLTNSDIILSRLQFIDRNNKLWVWDNGGENKTFPALSGSTAYPQLLVDVECDEPGAIDAAGTGKFYKKEDGEWVEVLTPGEQSWSEPELYGSAEVNGTIYQTVGVPGLKVWQYSDAVVGNEEESDESLRSRRYQMLGNNSITVLEGLKGSLLNINGIKDVYIFNCISSTSLTLDSDYQPLDDGNTLEPNSVYIAIRYEENVDIDDKIIGRIIYNKMTPGITTNQVDGNVTNGVNKQFAIPRTSDFTDYVYWKKCSAQHPTITLTFQINSNTYDLPSGYTTSHTPTSEVEKNIKNKLNKFIDNIKINEYLDVAGLMAALQQGDIPVNGNNTFYPTGGNINGSQLYSAKLSYFKYGTYSFIYTESSGIITGTLTIGA